MKEKQTVSKQTKNKGGERGDLRLGLTHLVKILDSSIFYEKSFYQKLKKWAVGRQSCRIMTSLARITAFSMPVSAASTPREIEGVRKGKIIGKQVKPVVGGRVLLTQKVHSAQLLVSLYPVIQFVPVV